MKGYVVTLMEVPQSVEVAERCVESGKQFGVDVEIIPAFSKIPALQEMRRQRLFKGQFDETFSNVEAVIGNFMTQYTIWKQIVKSGEPGIVLEHDAVFVSEVPELNDDIVNLGKPSYGSFNTKSEPGVYPMFSKPGGYIPGAHGYYLTPAGARQLIEEADFNGVYPCDLFLNRTNFPNIKEVYPWCVEAHDSFSTIQKEKGCLAKHNYGDDYELLD